MRETTTTTITAVTTTVPGLPIEADHMPVEESEKASSETHAEVVEFISGQCHTFRVRSVDWRTVTPLGIGSGSPDGDY